MTDDIDTSIFLDAKKFQEFVEAYVSENNSSFIEGTVKACEHFLVDPEDVVKLKLISVALRDKLQTEGMSDGYLKQEAQLPI